MKQWLKQNEIAKIFSCAPNTVSKRIKGIMQQIEKGRYGKYAMLGTKVDIAVFMDYEKYHDLLEDPLECDMVPEYNALQAKMYLNDMGII